MTEAQIKSQATKLANFKKGYEVLSTSFPSIFINVGTPTKFQLSVVRNTNLKDGELTPGVHLNDTDGDYVQMKFVPRTDKAYSLSDYAQLQDMYAMVDDTDPIQDAPFISATVVKRAVDPALSTEKLKAFVDSLDNPPNALSVVLAARLEGKDTSNMVTFQAVNIDFS